MGNKPNVYDVARGGSALVVLVAHAVHSYWVRYTGPDAALATVTSLCASYAVYVFFGLSGALITRSILANVSRNGRFDGADYLASRIARIYPPLIGSIVLMYAIVLVIRYFDLPGGRYPYGLPSDLFQVRETFGFAAKHWKNALIAEGGFLQPNGPLWSLYIEMKIYIVAFGVAGLVFWRNASSKTIGLAIAGAGFYYGQQSTDFAFYLSIWLAGAALNVPFFANRIGFIDLGNGIAVRSLANTAGYSYSLYILHFPLLLFTMSLTQAWAGDSVARSVAVTIISLPVIVALSAIFARHSEKSAWFKEKLLLSKQSRNSRRDRTRAI
jgi:peptidoglycan/LPS O-acetylase OafA/YrhL